MEEPRKPQPLEDPKETNRVNSCLNWVFAITALACTIGLILWALALFSVK